MGNNIGNFSLSDLTGVDEAQVNQVLAIDGKLFVAYGIEGLLILDVNEN